MYNFWYSSACLSISICTTSTDIGTHAFAPKCFAINALISAFVLNDFLSDIKLDKKLIESIADGLSVMDKTAEIQKDKKGNVLYDDATKDIEIVKFDESIEAYMAREVLPHVPDAVAVFEEDTNAKNPVIKTGAEIPFTKYFYEYNRPNSSSELQSNFFKLEQSIKDKIINLFGEN